MKCAICGIEIESIDEAIEQWWIPYFYKEETEHESACPGCSEIFLELGEDGEMEVKEEYRGKIKYFDEKVKADLIIEVMLNWGLSKIGKREKLLMFWLVYVFYKLYVFQVVAPNQKIKRLAARIFI